MKRRSIRSRADARIVAHRVRRDTDTLWLAVRHQNGPTSAIRDDEVLPIRSLRNSARHVVQLLDRRRNHKS